MEQSDRGRGKRHLTQAQIQKRKRRRQRVLLMRAGCVLVGLLVIIGIIVGVRAGLRAAANDKDKAVTAKAQEQDQEKQQETQRQTVIEEAALMAAQYDYDGAITTLQSVQNYDQDEQITAAVAQYTTAKTQLVAVDPDQTVHVFFHTLVADPTITWNLSGAEAYKVPDYNEVMTTIGEFNAIMQEMYQNGYVLVSIRDLVVQNEDGTFSKNTNLMLPQGKKPFVLSQDDVSYYFYMQGDGFAKRLIVGEDGKPTNEYVQPDGTTVTGSYDVVPCLDDFIEQHPDFSYHGAKGLLALTGYNGVLGYRTDPDLALTAEQGNKYAEEDGVFDYEAEIEAAKPVVQAIKDDGWEFASHSYGHQDYGALDYDKFVTDADKWQQRVANVIGPTDIIIYAFGADIGSWTEYTADNAKYNYLYGQGFRYFCNVDSNIPWNQITSQYVRQGRINLDGYRMYQEIYNGAGKLATLFDATKVYDYSRPTDGLADWQGG